MEKKSFILTQSNYKISGKKNNKTKQRNMFCIKLNVMFSL